MDLYSRKIVGWTMRDHLRSELPLAALMMAIQRQRPGAGLIDHSAAAFICLGRISRRSTTRRWRASPRSNRTRSSSDASRANAQRDLFTFVEGFYNRTRIYSAIGNISPVEMEQKTT